MSLTPFSKWFDSKFSFIHCVSINYHRSLIYLFIIHLYIIHWIVYTYVRREKKIIEIFPLINGHHSPIVSESAVYMTDSRSLVVNKCSMRKFTVNSKFSKIFPEIFTKINIKSLNYVLISFNIPDKFIYAKIHSYIHLIHLIYCISFHIALFTVQIKFESHQKKIYFVWATTNRALLSIHLYAFNCTT